VHVSDTVQVYLNCNGKYATAKTPGASLGAQTAREAKASDDEKAAEEAAQAAQNEQDELADAGDSPGAPGAHG
jgi:hypothetical protein